MPVPASLPDLRSDLVVLSQVLYFPTSADIATLGCWLRARAHRSSFAVNRSGPTDEPHAVAYRCPKCRDHLKPPPPPDTGSTWWGKGPGRCIPGWAV